MVDGPILTRSDVRVAVPDEIDELRHLMSWSERSHLRFQTVRLAQILASGLVRWCHRTAALPPSSI